MKIIEVTNVDFSLRHFLLPLMRAMRGRGHEVIGACADGPLLAIPRAEGFRIVTPRLERTTSPLAHWRAFRDLVRLFRDERPDIVHAHMPISGFLARMAAWWVGVPRIAYTCHGFWFNFPGSWPRAAIAIGNGRDPALFRPDPAARQRIRADLNIPDERVVILAVSRLVWHKGYPELAEAMRSLPSAALWVVGERLASDRGPDMAAVLGNAGLGDRLRMLGYREDIPALMAAADIFTLPSRFEGLPMSIIEAMLTGLPVVAANVRGPAEQVEPEATGLLVPPGDAPGLAAALGRLASDPSLRAVMGNAGRARALERYDEAMVIFRTLDLMEL